MAELVARYGTEHKEETRQRSIQTAGRRFKQDGIDGSGIATLMKDAGLPNGAFYAHFGSKEDLVGIEELLPPEQPTNSRCPTQTEPIDLRTWSQTRRVAR